MRSVVIYCSRYGNTERIARAAPEGLSERGEARAIALGDARPGDLEAAGRRLHLSDRVRVQGE